MREFIVAEMISSDFGCSEVTLAALNDRFRVGAGMYLLVPVTDSQEAEDIKDLIGSKANRSVK